MFKAVYDFLSKKNYEIIVYIVIDKNISFKRDNYNLKQNQKIHFILTSGQVESIKFRKKIHLYEYDKSCFVINISGTLIMNYLFREYIDKKNYFCWVATSYYEEKTSLIKYNNYFKKTFFYLFEIPICRSYEKILLKKINQRVLCLSTYTKNNFNEIFKYKYKILYYPVLKNSSLRKKTFNQSLNIFFSGRINDPRKNIILFLNVVKRIHSIKKYSNKINFYLIGGPLNTKLKDFIDQENLNIKIIDYLNKKDLDKILKKMHIFLLTSFQEGLCISALEGIFYGIPIISTRCGGIEDIVIDDFNGYLTNFDSNKIKNNIINLYNKRKKYEEFSNNSLSRSSLFTHSVFEKKLLKYLNL